MRVGQNPTKRDPNLSLHEATHRVIIPVYIPNQEDYFEQSLDILRHTLESLIRTCHNQTAITVIDNGSCDEVKTYLRALLESQNIQCIIHHAHNIGKVDAVLQAARGYHEPLITVSDADVLFYPGWQGSVEELHVTFPKTGLCSPCPMPNMTWHHNAPMWWDNWLGLKFRFKHAVDPTALDLFEASINRQGKHFKPVHRAQQLTITKDNVTACVGCGHFIATFKRNALLSAPSSLSGMALGGKSVATYFDTPSEKQGYWRLSTTTLFAEHMGNRIEQRFTDHISTLPKSDPPKPETTKFPAAKAHPRLSPLKRRGMGILKRLGMHRLILKRVGLSKDFNPDDV